MGWRESSRAAAAEDGRAPRGGSARIVNSPRSTFQRNNELRPFSLAGDSFRKIVVRGDIGRRWFDDAGILHVGLADFLLDPAPSKPNPSHSPAPAPCKPNSTNCSGRTHPKILLELNLNVVHN